MFKTSTCLVICSMHNMQTRLADLDLKLGKSALEAPGNPRVKQIKTLEQTVCQSVCSFMLGILCAGIFDRQHVFKIWIWIHSFFLFCTPQCSDVFCLYWTFVSLSLLQHCPPKIDDWQEYQCRETNINISWCAGSKCEAQLPSWTESGHG